MGKIIGSLSVLICLITACSAGRTVTCRQPFPEAEYAMVQTHGNGKIHGQVFLKTKDGEVMPSAGNKVILNPVTSYSSQWYEVAVRDNHQLSAPDPRLMAYVREAVTDAKGRFVFNNIPEGAYFLSTPLFWKGPWPVGSGANSTIPQGRYFVKKVCLQKGEELEVPFECRVRSSGDALCIIQHDSNSNPSRTIASY